ncbi:MAG: hypothetical protein JXB13_04470 [Phycisphaerae bacterium]|nr:hypothetical protein [Phycisphaerae bacterium]
MKKLDLIIVLATVLALTASAEWEIWISPSSKVVKPNEPIVVRHGISGMGALKPDEIKIAVYGDGDTMLHDYNNPTSHYSMMLTFPTTNANTFTLPAGDKRGGLQSDNSQAFLPFSITSKRTGDKSISLVLTYKTESGQWQTKTSTFSYHVSTWYERNETWLQWIALIAAITGI